MQGDSHSFLMKGGLDLMVSFDPKMNSLTFSKPVLVWFWHFLINKKFPNKNKIYNYEKDALIGIRNRTFIRRFCPGNAASKKMERP
jgi:hypothetical protein